MELRLHTHTFDYICKCTSGNDSVQRILSGQAKSMKCKRPIRNESVVHILKEIGVRMMGVTEIGIIGQKHE